MNGKGIETFAICSTCQRAFRGDEVSMVPSRRGDGWVAIRCDDCGGYQSAKRAEQRRESRVRAAFCRRWDEKIKNHPDEGLIRMADDDF